MKTKFYESLKNLNLGTCDTVMAFPVTLLSSGNKYFIYPVKGVIVINEQGTDLSAIVATFHRQKDDGSLCAGVSVPRPVFTYGEVASDIDETDHYDSENPYDDPGIRQSLAEARAGIAPGGWDGIENPMNWEQ